MGFVPRSSVCNICFANDFDHVYEIYKTDKEGWQKVLALDYAMAHKPEDHQLKDDVFMFKFQADNNVRLYEIDMEEWKKQHDKEKETGQLSLFDGEQAFGCNGGCFL